jgi:sugar lactone lactonase YvrE
MRWCEGPAWFGAGRYLLWSDIPNNRIMRWQEETGAVSVFRQPSNNANGNTRDRQGRLMTCEHDTRRITRTEYDGTITVLMDKFDGKPLNSPNDIVVKSDDEVNFGRRLTHHSQRSEGGAPQLGTADGSLPSVGWRHNRLSRPSGARTDGRQG